MDSINKYLVNINRRRELKLAAEKFIRMSVTNPIVTNSGKRKRSAGLLLIAMFLISLTIPYTLLFMNFGSGPSSSSSSSTGFRFMQSAAGEKDAVDWTPAEQQYIHNYKSGQELEDNPQLKEQYDEWTQAYPEPSSDTDDADIDDDFDVDRMFDMSQEEYKMKVNLLVTVGIKTFNRPSCALNLVKSILFYYPGINVILVNDGELPLRVDEKSWRIRDPALIGSDGLPLPLADNDRYVDVDLDVRYELISDVDEYMVKRDRGLLPRVVYADRSMNKSKITIIDIPFDSGVSAGRNVLVHACETKYLLMTDDDYEFLPETDLVTMMNLLESSEQISPRYDVKVKELFDTNDAAFPVDIVGGIRTESKQKNRAFPRGSNFELSEVRIDQLPNGLDKYAHFHTINSSSDGPALVNVLKIVPSTVNTRPDALGITETEEPATFAELMHAGNCMPTEFIQQFFMARVSTLRGANKASPQILWDPHLKNNDHYDFFLRARNAVLSDSENEHKKASIVACKAIKYQHAKETNQACLQDTRSPVLQDGAHASTYMEFRNRWVKFVPYLFKKWQIGLVVDDEIGKTIVIERDGADDSKCRVLELRADPKRNKVFEFECGTLPSYS